VNLSAGGGFACINPILTNFALLNHIKMCIKEVFIYAFLFF
jgi:hypothetical protein